MVKELAVEFKNVCEKYDLEIILDGKSSREKFQALWDINFAVEKGQGLAIIGPNGAGKSTILRLIAGLIRPDSGEVRVAGRIGSLLDLGAGFHPEMTGRDNLLLNASLYNLGHDFINSRLEEIIKFSGIGKFIDAPLKAYSQGMYVRLAFSLAINVDPEILLIDDCLAVGDEEFQARCIDKVLELKEKKTTIIFVTHDTNLAKLVCDRAIFIKDGKIVKDASVAEAASLYSRRSDINVNIYRYLGRKIQEEERRKKEVALKKRDEELKSQEEARKKNERERLAREEVTKRKKEQELSLEKGLLNLRFDSGKIKIYYDNTELTALSGLYASFISGSREFNSRGARSRIKKLSDTEWRCYFKWLKPLSAILVWKISLADKNAIDLEIVLQTRGGRIVRNQRLELELTPQSRPSGIDPRNNKSGILNIEGKPDLSFLSFQERKISGYYLNEAGGPSLYFLTIPEKKLYTPDSGKSRGTYFKGAIRLDQKSPVKNNDGVPAQVLRNGGLEASFKDGHIVLYWQGKRLTEGFGLYSSINSQGVWYDSTQAIWEIKETRAEELVVEGFWPWIPVSQVWKLNLTGKNIVSWQAQIQVYEDMVMDIQEAAAMLSKDYTLWSAGDKKGVFPEEFTRDDVFRYCLWSHDSDGKISLNLSSPSLPAISFKPCFQEQYRLVLENSAQIYATPARLLHCMRFNKEKPARFKPGKYELFKGQITVEDKK